MEYTRRESIEIYGLPESISDKELESKCMDILTDIGCEDIVDKKEIVSCHRRKNRKKTSTKNS